MSGVTLTQFYKLEHSNVPAFPQTFLNPKNITYLLNTFNARIASEMGITEEDTIRPKKLILSDDFGSKMVIFAKRFADSGGHPDVLSRLNSIFIETYLSGFLADCGGEYMKFERFRQQGVPDPLNIARPQNPERECKEYDLSKYTLSHPHRHSGRYPRF